MQLPTFGAALFVLTINELSINMCYYCKYNLSENYQLSNMKLLNLKITLATFAIFCLFSIQKVKAQVNTQDSLALVDLYNSTGGANWTKHTNWLTTAPVSSWFGVNVIGGGVNVVNLPSNNLTGTIPATIGQLRNLQELFLDSNHVSGIIPASIGNLSNLVVLWLNSNQLTDSIPSGIANLTKLQSLNLNINKLTGSIPSSLGSLPNLRVLGLDNNKLEGNIPLSFSNLTNLTSLMLEVNQLTGSIPDIFANLTKLAYLNLSYNKLGGNIPASIGKLTSLIYLALVSDKLSGTIPDFIGNLTKLQSLYLYSNQFSGTIPKSIGNLTNLQILYLSNNQLTGSISSFIGNFTNLTFLDLDNNQLTGGLPVTLGNLRKLTYFYLQNNLFSDTIPAIIGTLTSLQRFQLNNNKLTGSIPASLGNLTKLNNFTLNNNQLSGSIPASIGNITKLTDLNLSNNNLSGAIPASLGNLVNLTSLSLSNNNFTFDGMEVIATKFPFAVYAPQAIIPLYSVILLGGGETMLSASVGGIPTNNTYSWYNSSGLVATVNADSTYWPTVVGYYYVRVTNSLAPKLILHSDTITIANLPIKSIALQAMEVNGEVKILWQTINEINTASFTTQHSIDGITYNEIDTKAAVGEGDNSYSLLDKSPIGGINYYRLKSIDKDGSFSYSKVASVQIVASRYEIVVVPNPAKEKVIVKGNHIISVKVVDNMGRVLKNVSFKDVSNPILSLTGMAAGVYHLRVQTSDGKVTGVGFVVN